MSACKDREKNKQTLEYSQFCHEIDELANENPDVFASNVWPAKLTQLKPCLMDVAQTIHKIGIMLAKLCNVYVQSKVSHDLFHVICSSKTEEFADYLVI